MPQWLAGEATKTVVDSFISDFYLDDVTVAGKYEDILKDFETWMRKFGLQMRIALLLRDRTGCNKFNEISPGIIVVNELTLLRAPLTESSFVTVFNKKLCHLKLLFGRLVDLDHYQIAYILFFFYSRHLPESTKIMLRVTHHTMASLIKMQTIIKTRFET